jgi:hypothetical protein
MPREEMISMYIQTVSGHSKEVEIFESLSALTAHNASNEIKSKYKLQGYNIKQLEKLLYLGLEGRILNDEERAWNFIIDVLSPAVVFDIIQNADKHIERYKAIRQYVNDYEAFLVKNWFDELTDDGKGLGTC